MRSSAVPIAMCATLLATVPVVPALARRAPAGPMWQMLITPADRIRLRAWRDAWLDGLAQARAAGAGARIAAEGVLLDPDAGLEDPVPPDGDYRCRTIKLGTQDPQGQAFTSYPGVRCRIEAGRLVTLGGPQRPAGGLWPYDGARLLFLGAMALGDERRALDYGRDGQRDMVGLVERIGEARWRLVLPRPRWQSQVDVVELVPARG